MSAYPLQRIAGAAPAPTLLLAPGNGFPPRCYAPLFAPMGRAWQVLSLPPRAMWPDSGPAPQEPGSWDAPAADLLAGMAQHDLREVVAVGHSLGATVLLLAALRAPQRFRALALLDPAILTPERLQLLREVRARCPQELRQLPLAQGALSRRQRFPDLQTAFRHWRPKALFADWSDEALWAAARGMTHPAADGAGLELVWRRDWEAWYYMSVATEAWSALAQLEDRLPTLLAQGADSEVFPAASLQRARRLLPAATLVTLPDCGHLFPLGAPAATRAALEAWLRALG